MVQLSVVIVSYNVSHFLHQTLQSVERAIEGLNAEVFVVDNASSDDSVAMVGSAYPWVRLIANQDNVGFSAANNQAIKLAIGKYILLLNPDVVVAEDTFRHCLQFMDNHPDAGGLGVRMVDGSGVYLPESKRGLPTPWVSFCKIVGLAGAFPTSKTFARYYLGHLDAGKDHEVEILSGAFMLMRKSTLDKIGLLDETFFMYGEDVDLSYRIILGGEKNYYTAGTTIIHYKGESTKKGSLKYVRVFYQAMAIFARKHFVKSNNVLASKTLDLMLGLAIWLRALLSALSRGWQLIRKPLLDAVLIGVGMYILKEYWQANHKRVPGDYPPSFMLVVVPAYILAWLSSVWMLGGYRKQPKADNIVRGLVVGMVLISAVTNFFDDWRFSKALILLGTGWSMAAMIGWRLLAGSRQAGLLGLGDRLRKRLLLVANDAEQYRIAELIKSAGVEATIAMTLKPEQITNELVHSCQSLEIDEVIFSNADLSNKAIIETIADLKDKLNVRWRIVPAGSDYIIGSSDKNNPGDYYSISSTYKLLLPGTLQRKRRLELLVASMVMLLSPVVAVLTRRSVLAIWRMTFNVLSGRSWVMPTDQSVASVKLLLAKKGVKTGAIQTPSGCHHADGAIGQTIDHLYVAEYSMLQDLKFIWLALKTA